MPYFGGPIFPATPDNTDYTIPAGGIGDTYSRTTPQGYVNPAGVLAVQAMKKGAGGGRKSKSGNPAVDGLQDVAPTSDLQTAGADPFTDVESASAPQQSPAGATSSTIFNNRQLAGDADFAQQRILQPSLAEQARQREVDPNSDINALRYAKQLKDAQVGASVFTDPTVVGGRTLAAQENARNIGWDDLAKAMAPLQAKTSPLGEQVSREDQAQYLAESAGSPAVMAAREQGVQGRQTAAQQHGYATSDLQALQEWLAQAKPGQELAPTGIGTARNTYPPASLIGGATPQQMTGLNKLDEQERAATSGAWNSVGGGLGEWLSDKGVPAGLRPKTPTERLAPFERERQQILNPRGNPPANTPPAGNGTPGQPPPAPSQPGPAPTQASPASTLPPPHLRQVGMKHPTSAGYAWDGIGWAKQNVQPQQSQQSSDGTPDENLGIARQLMGGPSAPQPSPTAPAPQPALQSPPIKLDPYDSLAATLQMPKTYPQQTSTPASPLATGRLAPKLGLVNPARTMAVKMLQQLSQPVDEPHIQQMIQQLSR